MPTNRVHADLLSDFGAGKKTALARVISIVENRRAGFEEVMGTLVGMTGDAHRIGVTGPPGAGKSTLCAALAAAFREAGETVGVVAVDPTSPFTGGALLGDRIRLNDIALDDDVFIRSMATRGSVGGLALTTKEVADVMDAFGFDRVLIETVGVGQSELDVAAAADTTVVVLVPESGDSIQAMKAGLMEISDIFVVNKADRPGALRLAREIETVLRLRTGQLLRGVPAHHGVELRLASAAHAHTHDHGAAGAWEIPVLQTTAGQAVGVPELIDALARHRTWLAEAGELDERRRRRIVERVREAVERALTRRVWQSGEGEAILQDELPALLAGRVSPYDVAARIVGVVGG